MHVQITLNFENLNLKFLRGKTTWRCWTGRLVIQDNLRLASELNRCLRVLYLIFVWLYFFPNFGITVRNFGLYEFVLVIAVIRGDLLSEYLCLRVKLGPTPMQLVICILYFKIRMPNYSKFQPSFTYYSNPLLDQPHLLET